MFRAGVMRPAKIYNLSSVSGKPAGYSLGLFGCFHLELITLGLLLYCENGRILLRLLGMPKNTFAMSLCTLLVKMQ